MDFNKGIKEIEIEGERIFLKKSFLGWNIVHPIKTDGKINWKNLLAGGSWIKLGLIIAFVIITLGAIVEVANLIKIANECLNLNQFAIDVWKA